jgi:hypothetical protein
LSEWPQLIQGVFEQANGRFDIPKWLNDQYLIHGIAGRSLYSCRIIRVGSMELRVTSSKAGTAPASPFEKAAPSPFFYDFNKLKMIVSITRSAFLDLHQGRNTFISGR